MILLYAIHAAASLEFFLLKAMNMSIRMSSQSPKGRQVSRIPKGQGLIEYAILNLASALALTGLLKFIPSLYMAMFSWVAQHDATLLLGAFQ